MLDTVNGYGQYCPIALGAEVFAERWTPIILRNLLVGCERFGEILAGAPGLSRSVLSQRLRRLEQEGIVERVPTTGTGMNGAVEGLNQRCRPVGAGSGTGAGGIGVEGGS